MNFRSIGFRLVVWYTSLLTGILLLRGVVLYFGLQHFLENDMRESHARRARQIGHTLIAHMPQTGEGYLAEQMKSLYAPEINNRFIRLARDDGRLIYQSGPPADGTFNPSEVPTVTLAPGEETSQKIRLSGHRTMLVVIGDYPGENHHTYVVEVGALLDPVQAMLNHLFLQLALGLPLAVAVIALGGWLLIRRALQPVAEITRAAEQITHHNTSERVPVARTGDELEKLSVSLNRMIARLDDAFRNSTRFVADASHELRTPLTILHGELEMLAGDQQLPREARERVFSMLEEVGRLGKIVEKLFALSRLDAGEAQTDWQSLDLAEMARTTAEQMSLLAEDKHIAINCDAHQPVLVEGDPARLKQVLVNLLDNAVKYTPENGSIQLSVNRRNQQAILEVADNGIGIPADALPHVFKRFYRVDPSRTNDEGSAGLGLSIVKSICSAHGAEVEVQSALRKGSCFRVKFNLPKNYR